MRSSRIGKMGTGLRRFCVFGSATVFLASAGTAFGETSAWVPFESPITADEERTQQLDYPDGLRNTRYCEIFPIYFDKAGNRFVTEAYNTFTYNNCPDADWAALAAGLEDGSIDPEREFGAITVQLNGPRRWVIAGAGGKGSPYPLKIESFVDGMQSSMGAQIGGTDFGEVTYTEQIVHRWTTWKYAKGNQVFELIDTNFGREYIMQSYLEEKIAGIEDLPDIGPLLELPPGWEFRVRVLEEDFNLTACGDAFVIKDSLLNGYQRKDTPECS